MNGEDLSTLIGAVYDASLDDAGWENVLARLGRALSSPKQALVSIDTGSCAAAVQLCPGWDPADVARYERDYAQRNPIVLDATRRPLRCIRADTLLPDYDVYRRSAVCNEFFAPNAAQHVLGCFLLREGQCGLAIAFHRGSGAGPHNAAEHALFAKVLPHIVRSFRLHRRLQGARLASESLGEVIEKIGHAVLLVTADAHVGAMNKRAERLLTAGDGLCLRDGRVAAAASQTNHRLHRLIAATARARDGVLMPAGGALRVPRPSLRRAYEVLVTPLPRRVSSSLAGRAFALVFLRDPEETPRPEAATLAALYRLSPAEARFVSALAAGQSVKAYAEETGITENTARWTLKQVFSKTNTRSQSDLVRLVLSGPAARAVEGANGRGVPVVPE